MTCGVKEVEVEAGILARRLRRRVKSAEQYLPRNGVQFLVWTLVGFPVQDSDLLTEGSLPICLHCLFIRLTSLQCWFLVMICLVSNLVCLHVLEY